MKNEKTVSSIIDIFSNCKELNLEELFLLKNEIISKLDEILLNKIREDKKPPREILVLEEEELLPTPSIEIINPTPIKEELGLKSIVYISVKDEISTYEKFKSNFEWRNLKLEDAEEFNWIKFLKNYPNFEFTKEFISDPNLLIKVLEFPFIEKIFKTKPPKISSLLERLHTKKVFSSMEFIEVLNKAYDSYISNEEKEDIPELILTEHQQEIFDGLINKISEIMNSSAPSVLTQADYVNYMAVFEGAAGTGKTTTMSKILTSLVNSGYTMCFCSPTHQALGVIRNTLNEQGIDFTEDNTDFTMGDSNIIIKTLASFLGIKMQRNMETGEESFTTDKRANLFKVDILCIDESSMISKDQIMLILKRLRIDFKMILFIGDEPQLPSPSDNNQPNGIFNLPYKYSLTKVVRQAEGSKLLELAHYIRHLILSNNCNIKPSQLIPNFNNGNDICIYNDPQFFINNYINNEATSKVITTYTNKITNEYNEYIRNLDISNQIFKSDIDIYVNQLDRTTTPETKKFLTDWNEWKEFYPGEKIILSESNQKNGNIVHQNGEIVRIQLIEEKEHTVTVEVIEELENLGKQIVKKEYVIGYWELFDDEFKSIRVVKKEFIDIYNTCIDLLKAETTRTTGKFKWQKFYSFKEKFTKVNKLYAATLYKLQGSTYEDLYADIRDLDRFYEWNPIIVYKLLYVALTRPKQKIHILI